MTKKDYKVIAEAVRLYGDFIRENMSNGVNDAILDKNLDRIQASNTIILDLSNALERNYPNFDRDKFLEACGIN